MSTKKPHPPELTKRDLDFLHHLKFREGCKPGPCYLHRLPGGRWGLIVPTMMGWYERSPYWTRNARPLDRLEAAGWITRGPANTLTPIPGLTVEQGHTVELTNQARELIAARKPSAKGLV